jgi:hypothetical protein
MTFRAVIIGLLGAWVLAYLTPWNDWAAHNTLVHGSYIPPVLLIGLAVFSGLVNPRLGRWRLRPSETATILALVLVVGSMASIGLMRHFPAVLVEPSRSLQGSSSRNVWSQDGGAEQVAAVAARNLALAEQAIARHDHDHDGALSADERRELGLVLAGADHDGDGRLTAAELMDGLVRPVDGVIPPIPARLQATGDPADPAEPNSLEDERVAGGFYRGNQGGGLVPPGASIVLSASGGSWQLHYLGGHDALNALAAGEAVVDPGSDPRAGGLLTAPLGGEVTIDGKAWTVQRRDPAGIPWGPWLRGLLAWAPVILAMIAGGLAIAAIVRHQWEHNERLPLPIAGILSTLTGSDGDEGAGRPAIFSSRGFWIAAGAVILVHFSGFLKRMGWSPVAIPLELDLSAFKGVSAALDNSPDLIYLIAPKISLTMVAIAFLMTVEVSGSMWGWLVAANLAMGFAIAHGAQVSGADLDHGAVGAAGVLCLFTLWVGRRHYGAALLAAFGRSGSPEAAAAAPWIWVLLGVCAMLVAFMLSLGVPFLAALAVTLMIFGTMLALARVVAETGAPYASFGGSGRVSGIILNVLGPYCGAAVLMPLLMVGFVVGAGDRERLLPHVLHGMIVQDRSGRPGGQRLLVWIGVACLGSAILAFAGMLAVNYHLGQSVTDRFPIDSWRAPMTQGDAMLGDRATALSRSEHTWWAYAAGAAVFGLLSIARVSWSRFPLHPIGLIVIGGWVTKMNWSAYAIGWMLKLVVLRYGGQQLYRRLYPAVIGCILGEALVVIACMVVGLVRAYLGLGPIDLKILPS